jgi:hypothetical protein
MTSNFFFVNLIGFFNNKFGTCLYNETKFTHVDNATIGTIILNIFLVKYNWLVSTFFNQIFMNLVIFINL